MIRTCKQCGASFELTDSEIRYFQSRGLDLPKRCQACRKKNRTERQMITSSVKVSKPVSRWSPAKIAGIAGAVLLLAGGGIFAAIQAGRHAAEPERTVIEASLPETAPVTEAPTEQPTAPPTEPPTEPETEAVTEAPEITEAPAAVETKQKAEVTYYLNTYRKKFHKPDCPSVTQMNSKNRKKFYGTREEAIAAGYSPCHNCNP